MLSEGEPVSRAVVVAWVEVVYNGGCGLHGQRRVAYLWVREQQVQHTRSRGILLCADVVSTAVRLPAAHLFWGPRAPRPHVGWPAL